MAKVGFLTPERVKRTHESLCLTVDPHPPAAKRHEARRYTNWEFPTAPER